MILALLIVSLVFFALSFIVTTNNAAQVLTGYNTMSEQERANVDIVGYVNNFRKFYRRFSIVYFVVGLLLYYLVDKDVAGIYMVTAPILSVLIQTRSAAKYSIQNNRKSAKVSTALLLGVLVFVAGLLYLGYKENKISFETDHLTISGVYGETIAYGDIDSIALVSDLPKITMKQNGFALGSASKGHFKTADGNSIKLIVNKRIPPYLLILKKDGKKIYFSKNASETKLAFSKLQTRINTP